MRAKLVSSCAAKEASGTSRSAGTSAIKPAISRLLRSVSIPPRKLLVSDSRSVQEYDCAKFEGK